MQDRRRAAITGIGVVGPTGVGKDAFWQSLVSGRQVIRPITRFDANSYACRIAGEIQDDSYRDLVPPKKLRYGTRVILYGLAATELALRDSHLDSSLYEVRRRGVSIGTSLGGLHEAHQQAAVLQEKGASRVNPFLMSGVPSYAAAAEIAIAAQALGSHATFGTGCCAGMHAVGHAADLIASGQLDVCLAGGTEAPITPIVLATMSRTGEICSRNDDPAHASCPFDRAHSGLILSEGSTVLILEDSDSARRRGATIYAEVLGHSSSIDGSELFEADDSGITGAQAVQTCLTRSGLTPTDIDYVCANGNSLPSFDRKETSVLKRALGEAAMSVPVSSIKGVLGHPFGASPAFQIAAACLAIQQRTIPPTCNLQDPDPLCDLDFVPNVSRAADLQHVLVCSYGFGGINAFMVLRAPCL